MSKYQVGDTVYRWEWSRTSPYLTSARVVATTPCGVYLDRMVRGRRVWVTHFTRKYAPTPEAAKEQLIRRLRSYESRSAFDLGQAHARLEALGLPINFPNATSPQYYD